MRSPDAMSQPRHGNPGVLQPFFVSIIYGIPDTGIHVLTHFRMPVLIMDLMFLHLIKQSPFFIRPIFSATQKQLQKLFVGPELAKIYSYLNDQLGDQEYFMGSSPGRADFIVSWPIDLCGRLPDAAKLNNYPNLKAWNDRCKARDGWKRSIEKGNGYLDPNMGIDHVDE